MRKAWLRFGLLALLVFIVTDHILQHLGVPEWWQGYVSGFALTLSFFTLITWDEERIAIKKKELNAANADAQERLRKADEVPYPFNNLNDNA